MAPNSTQRRTRARLAPSGRDLPVPGPPRWCLLARWVVPPYACLSKKSSITPYSSALPLPSPSPSRVPWASSVFLRAAHFSIPAAITPIISQHPLSPGRRQQSPCRSGSQLCPSCPCSIPPSHRCHGHLSARGAASALLWLPAAFRIKTKMMNRIHCAQHGRGPCPPPTAARATPSAWNILSSGLPQVHPVVPQILAQASIMPSGVLCPLPPLPLRSET